MAEANQSSETDVERVDTVTDPAILTKFEEVLGVTDKFHLSLLQGRQRVVPNKRPGESAKLIYMSQALFRFKEQEADFLVTLNTEIDDEGNSATPDIIVPFFKETIVNQVNLPFREAFLALFPS